MNKKKLTVLENHSGYLMRLVSNSISSNFAFKLSKMDITISEWVIMRIMFDYNTITHGDIVKLSGLTKGAITKTLNKLLEKEFIQKIESTTDARSQLICLSKNAKNMVPKLSEISDKNEEDYFSFLNVSEKEALKAILQKIIKIRKITGTPTN